MIDIYQRLEEQLSKRKIDGNFRELTTYNGVDFYSNDYLGYAKIIDDVQSNQYGSTGSRLISGNSSLVEEVEKKIATFFESESALIFNSGYDANIGLLSSVPQKNDVIIYDQYVHASMRDGIRLSLARSYHFSHQSITELEKKIRFTKKTNVTIFVCVESLYSMEGTIAPLHDILKLCEKYKAHLIVDEAHAGGIYGARGQGILHALNLHEHPNLFARIFTFGKAFGRHGAAVLGRESLKKYLINYARSFIYTTALPPQTIEQISQSIFRSEFHFFRNKLLKNILYFLDCFKENDFKLYSDINSPIQMIKIGNVKQTIELASFLQKHKFIVKAILSPTVPYTHEAIRICIHAFNTKYEIEQLAELLNKYRTSKHYL